MFSSWIHPWALSSICLQIRRRNKKVKSPPPTYLPVGIEMYNSSASIHCLLSGPRLSGKVISSWWSISLRWTRSSRCFILVAYIYVPSTVVRRLSKWRYLAGILYSSNVRISGSLCRHILLVSIPTPQSCRTISGSIQPLSSWMAKAAISFTTPSWMKTLRFSSSYSRSARSLTMLTMMASHPWCLPASMADFVQLSWS